MQQQLVEPTAFRDAVARFAGGVTVITTVDPTGRPVGFTATAFNSLSLDPPLVLVCLAKSADSHAAFLSAPTFAVSILAADQGSVARRFAIKGIDKFDGVPIGRGVVSRLPTVLSAAAHLECRIVDRLDGGDHTILVGEVLAVASTDRPPLLYFNRHFGGFVPKPGDERGRDRQPVTCLHRRSSTRPAGRPAIGMEKVAAPAGPAPGAGGAALTVRRPARAR
jgi:flavin reductase (DIM6/NTAB) family NADH-FMN oxidoreductase RutF